MKTLPLLTLSVLVLASACDKTPEGVEPTHRKEIEKPTPTPPNPAPTPVTDDKPKPQNEDKVFSSKDFRPDMLRAGVLTIPKEYTVLEASSFKGRGDISILVAEGLTRIGTEAFASCPQLRKLELPAVKHIGAKAFDQCKALDRLDLPTLEHIGDNAFRECIQLKQLNIPNIKYLGIQAFYATISLQMVRMGTTVPQADASAFRLSTVAKVLSVSEGAGSAFTHFANSHRFASIEGAEALKANFSPLPAGSEVAGEVFKRLGGSGEHINDLVLAPQYRKVDTRAFWEASNLHGLFASNGITEIAEAGLKDCPNIRVVDLPQLRRLGQQALEGCSRLEYLNIPRVEELGNNALERCYNLEYLSMPALKHLGQEALTSCKRLRTLELGAKPPHIGANVFGSSRGQYGIQSGQITLIVPQGSKQVYEVWSRPFPQIGNIIERTP